MLIISNYRFLTSFLAIQGPHAGRMGYSWWPGCRLFYRLAADPGSCSLHQRQIQEGRLVVQIWINRSLLIFTGNTADASTSQKAALVMWHSAINTEDLSLYFMCWIRSYNVVCVWIRLACLAIKLLSVQGVGRGFCLMLGTSLSLRLHKIYPQVYVALLLWINCHVSPCMCRNIYLG